MSGSALSQRLTVGIAILGTASLVAGFGAAIFGEPSPIVRSAEADSFSRSALGHRGFVELLRRTERRVVVSRSRSARRAARDGVLVLLEPPGDRERLGAMLEGVDRALVVLPKREPFASETRADRVEAVALYDASVPESVLAALDVEGVVVRTETPFTLLPPGMVEPPALVQPQLVTSADLDPVVESPDGILIGVARPAAGVEHWVVTDPDLIQNHGLGDGSNAALALAIVDRITRSGDALVVDETLHGHEVAPHVWGALGRFPLVLALLQSVAALAVLLWIASRRFGAPVAEPTGLEPGRRALVDSTAELLVHGGHSGSILSHYLRIEERRVARSGNLARGLDGGARRAELRRLEARRAPSVRLDDVVRAVADARDDATRRDVRILEAARLVHRWRTEMLHGAH